MFAETMTAVLHGIDALPVTVETNIEKGMPVFQIVGLADQAVNEAKERIRSALHFSGLDFPMGRITVNMAPAGIRKHGSHFDASIALSILASSGQINPKELFDCCLIGELSLDGRMKRVDGALAIAASMEQYGIRKLFLPEENFPEVSLVKGMQFYPASSLAQLVAHFSGKQRIPARIPESIGPHSEEDFLMDFADVHGQETAKRALLVAATGGHGILMLGTPSSGKTMLAERLPTILPPMTEKEILRTSMIWSIAGQLEANRVIRKRPFRSPGTMTTVASLLGGGLNPRPGEISMADSGILFLDEVCEFSPRVIDSLRAPLEKKSVEFMRFGESYRFPANFVPVFASNLCKCGYYGDPNHVCTCSDSDLARYRAKLSGPILDRMDMTITLPPVSYENWKGARGMSSQEMREKLLAARERQAVRYHSEDRLNGEMTDTELDCYVPITGETDSFLQMAYRTMGLDPRGLQKIRRVARTIADLDGEEFVETKHLAEAIRYREDVFQRNRTTEQKKNEIG